jgi:probable HAF family extracellular repeat protein
MPIHVLRPPTSIMRCRFWLALAILVLFSGPAWSQEYTVTDLGTLGGSSSIPFAVNNAGQVVGEAYVAGDTHSDPFLYSKGTMKDVWPGGTQFGGITVALNNSGHFVVNYITDAAGDTESYLWNGINWAALGTGGAIGMNSSDTVVGNGPNGYWLYANNLLNTSPGYSIPGGHGAVAYGINDSGSIVGECSNADPIYGGVNGCVFGPNASYPLQAANEGGEYTYAIASDDETCGMDNIERSAGWSNDGTLTFNFGYYGKCLGLDDYGDAVGFFEPDLPEGYIYDPVNKMRDLNKLISQVHHKGPLMIITSAQSISDAGFIAASCGYQTWLNATTWTLTPRACLLTPNWSRILKDNIEELGKGDPECIQCKTELEPEVNSLPSSFADLSNEKKEKAVATLEKIKTQLLALRDGDRISEPATVLLLHDTEMALQALGHPRG